MGTSVKWIGPALIFVVLLVSTVGSQPRGFVVAIVRTDGRLVPFAAYDGARWDTAWPEPVEWMPGNPTLDAVPSVWRRRGESVPDRWQVWRIGQERSIETRISGAELVEAHCEAQIALKTDLPEARTERPAGEAIEGRAGVAVDSSTAPVAAIETVRASTPSWSAAERVVLSGFSALETGRAKAGGARLPVEAHAPLPRLTALYRESMAPGSPMYFVAEKSYRTARLNDAGCAARTIITGWLVPATDGAFNLRETRVFLTDCDGKEARTALPLAALRLSGRLLWVLQEHGYEDESYVIAEVGPSEVRYPLTVLGGGC